MGSGCFTHFCDESNSQKEGVPSIPVGQAHQRKLETSGHVASSGRKQKAMDSGITSLSPFYLACENVLLTGEGGSSHLSSAFLETR